MYTTECYSTMKKKEMLPFAVTWMELEGVILSEISQKEKGILHELTGEILKKSELVKNGLEW